MPGQSDLSRGRCVFPEFSEGQAQILKEARISNDRPINSIRGQFEAIEEKRVDDFTVRLPDFYNSRPLVSEEFVRKIGARAWATPDRLYKLPNVHFYSSRFIRVKFEINNKFYIEECGLVSKKETELVFRENGWCTEDGEIPDLVISPRVEHQAKETRINFEAQRF